MGAHTVILRHNPDHEDLLTATDSEVFYRLVGTWVGQGGKSSLVNTTDADILEYILVKLASRIETKTRTFLVKVKAHRGDPLNEGADDLEEAGHSLGLLGDFRFEGTSTVGDDSCDPPTKSMGGGFCNFITMQWNTTTPLTHALLQEQRLRESSKVDREEEGLS